MIPKNITREHVIKGIEEIETSGFPAARTSRKFLLKYNGKDYPPKYVLSIANKYANGKKLAPNEFKRRTRNKRLPAKLRISDRRQKDKRKNNLCRADKEEKRISL